MVIEIIVEAKLVISTKKIQSLNKAAYESLKDLFTYKNPKYIENQKWGYSNHGTPKHLYGYEVLDGQLLISRGGKEKVEKNLYKFGIKTKWVDRTLVCESVSFEQSNLVPREDQELFIDDMLKHDHGSAVAYACLAGDSVIRLNRGGNGSKYTIKEIHNKLHGNPQKIKRLRTWSKKELGYYKVRSFNGTSIQLNNLIDCTYSGVRETWEVALEDGKKLTATEDHRFLTDSGYVMVRNLVSGKSIIMTDAPHAKGGDNHLKPEKSHKVSSMNVMGIWHHPHACKSADSNYSCGWTMKLPVHRLIFEADMNGLLYDDYVSILRTDPIKSMDLKYIAQDLDIHHIDFNNKNNDISNLQLLTRSEHRKLHCNAGQKFHFGQGVPKFSMVKSIKAKGKQDTYDIQVEAPHHNFCANDIVVHNSFGKTLTMLEMARRIGQPVIVLVHTTFLQEQWIQEATDPLTFNMSKDDIGGVGGIFAGKKRRFRKLNICLYHSLAKEDHMDFFKDRVGLVFFDEGQKSPIDGVQGTVNEFRARYRYTASASLTRKDGKEFMTFDTFGPIRHIAIETASDSKIMSEITLVPSPYTDHDDDGSYTNMITRMASDKDRNILICKRALAKIKQGKLVLIFVERKFQAAIIAKYLSKYKGDMLLGATNWKDFSIPHLKEKFKGTEDRNKRKALLAKMESAKFVSPSMLEILRHYDDKTAYKRIEALAATKDINWIIGTQKAEVGLSLRTIDHLVVTTPSGNNDERFKQVIGRSERTYKQKEIDFFGHEKDIPTVDVIVDSNLASSRNAGDKIKEVYGKRVTKAKRKRRRPQ